MAKGLVQAKEALWVATEDGRGRLVSAGELLDSSDPIVKANPDRFQTTEEAAATAVSPSFGPDVEAATAAPGEARATQKPDESEG